MGQRIGELPPVSPPDAVYVKSRWVPVAVVDWVKESNSIMLEHGAVYGTVRQKYSSARWHARRLIDLMVKLEMHQRWELVEHVERRGDGWLWSVEHVGRSRQNG